MCKNAAKVLERVQCLKRIIVQMNAQVCCVSLCSSANNQYLISVVLAQGAPPKLAATQTCILICGIICTELDPANAHTDRLKGFKSGRVKAPGFSSIYHDIVVRRL